MVTEPTDTTSGQLNVRTESRSSVIRMKNSVAYGTNLPPLTPHKHQYSINHRESSGWERLNAPKIPYINNLLLCLYIVVRYPFANPISFTASFGYLQEAGCFLYFINASLPLAWFFSMHVSSKYLRYSKWSSRSIWWAILGNNLNHHQTKESFKLE